MKLRAARALIAIGTTAILTAAGVLTAAEPAFAAGVTATFTRTSSWETGFEGKYVITNGGTTALTEWTVAFDLPTGVTISSSWDSVRTDTGTRHSFRNAGNGNVPVGGTASFGFVAGGSSSATPANSASSAPPRPRWPHSICGSSTSSAWRRSTSTSRPTSSTTTPPVTGWSTH